MQLWDKQRGENSKAFEAFRTWRDLGPDRTYKKTQQALGRTGTTFVAQCTKWAATYNWADRLDAWERHIDRKSQTTTIREARRHRRRQAAVLRAGQSGLLKPLQAIMLKDKMALEEMGLTTVQELATLPAKELVDLHMKVMNVLTRCVKMENDVIGVDTHNSVEQQNTIKESIHEKDLPEDEEHEVPDNAVMLEEYRDGIRELMTGIYDQKTRDAAELHELTGGSSN